MRAHPIELGLTAHQTVEKLADYEDEIHQLRAQSRATVDPARSVTPPNNPSDDAVGPASPSKSYYIPDRLSSFLSSRKSTVNLQAASVQSPGTPTTTELVAALTREQNLRQAAEKKLDGSSAELEELSAQLFTQANEMVATERKARAKLEERVEVLEKRDTEKRARLDKLEGALSRIDRVRGLLAPGGARLVVEKTTQV